jgi:CHAD domain-containing protein
MEQLDAPERHKLRIAVKKLRYATGFFACLFNHPKTKKARKYFEKELKALQSALGKLNDMFASAAWAEVCSLWFAIETSAAGGICDRSPNGA